MFVGRFHCFASSPAADQLRLVGARRRFLVGDLLPHGRVSDRLEVFSTPLLI